MTKTVHDYFELNKPNLVDGARFYKADVSLPVIDSDIAVGIEVEVENHDLRASPNGNVWFSKGDGSLRNTGIEWITAPIAARYAPAALQDLLGNSLSQNCCFSPRTSVHVHVDMQQFNTKTVIDATMLYTVFEGLFYKFTGRGRIKNIYCVPIFDTSMLTGAAGPDASLTGLMENWSKYSGLNLLPLSSLGTIEFRHMHGTFDVTKLSTWIRIIIKLVEFVRKQGTEFVRKLILGINETIDFRALMRDIWGDDADAMKFQSYQDIARGVNVVRTAFVNRTVTTELYGSLVKTSPYFGKLQGA